MRKKIVELFGEWGALAFAIAWAVYAVAYLMNQ